MNNIRVRLPRKLTKSVSGVVLAEAGRLHPVGALKITLNMLPLHRVTMTLAENDLDLAMHDLVEVYNQNGSVGVYRVTKITNTMRKERKIELSHGLDVFSDATIARISDGWHGSVRDYLQMIIDGQTQKIGGQFYWKLGQCDDTSYWEKDLKYDNAMTLLTDLAKTEEDYMFTFDQSTFPWTLNFIRRNDAVLSEFRLRRNTESCVITLDDSDLCTRLYLSVSSENEDDSGAGTYFTEGYYTFDDAAAQAIYGIVCKTAGIDQSVFSPTVDLEAWKNAYFARHNAPNVQITIDGMELNKYSREPIDEMHLGRMCRVALPDYGNTYNERIVSVNYPDALRKANYVRVSLHNKRETAEDAFQEISDTASSSSSSAKSGGRSSHNDATYFRRTIGDTANGLYSRIEQTAYYIRSEVVDTANGLYSKIEQTASYIRSEVANTANGLNSKIEQTASYIRSEVSNTANGLYSKIEETASYIRTEVANTASGLRSSITEQANRISLVVEGTGSNAYVRPASITAAITDSNGKLTSSITVDADNVYIGNTKSTTVINGKCQLSDVTADYINTKLATIPTLNGIAASFSGNVSTTSGVIAYQVYADGHNISDPVMDVQISGPTNNSYKLQKKTATNSSWTDAGSFSRAVASWTMGWSNGKFTAKANPQDQSCFTTISQGTTSWDGNTATIPINATDSDNPNYSYATGRNITVDASSIYSAGETAGYNGCHLSGSWGSGNESNKLIIGKTTSGSANSLAYVITAAASISYNSSTNKFVATGKAKVDGTEKDNASDSSGEISIAFNSLQGSGGSAYRTVSVKNGSTAIRTSGNLTDYGDGYTAGYNAGWNAACAKVTRSGNKIYGPVTGKATASSGQTEVKFTANYTASSHSYTPSSYSASSYTKESHSYTASSHSFSQAICKTNGTNHTKYWYNSNFSGSVEYHPATDSYTASSHSYTASKYTASSYTAESHSYTASSFSWT